LNEVAFPAYARMQADRQAVAASFAKALGLIMLVALPCYVGLAATAEPLVLTAMGTQWQGVVPLVRLLAFAMPFVTLHVLYPPATNALGQPRIGAMSAGAGAVLLPGAFTLGVQFGPVGMAAAWLVAMPILVSFSSSLSLPVIGLSWRGLAGAIVPALVAALGMGAAVTGLDRLLPPMAPAVRLMTLVSFGILSYGALVMVVARPAALRALTMIRGGGVAGVA
ncbi:MAG TPA: oligosaccharide flippase family protein, partial [Sphingomonas sp.]|nr:oligosaccharide flippase family protein [Sphingomonas sp.]